MFVAAVAALVAASSATARAQDAPEAQEEEEPAPYQVEARDLLRELVEINTTHSVGNTTAAARAMAAHLRLAGIPPRDIHILEEVPKKGNLIVRYRGRTTGRRPLLLLAHLDVVEADPADWSVEPFTLLEQDGYLYGRGTLDDKDEAAIHVANLVRMKAEDFVPDRDIIVALTADEEGGDHNGVEFLLEHHRELIDAEYALNEGGGGAIRAGARVSNGVQASEKVYQTFRLEVTDPGGHSSVPKKDNAIYHLADALVAIRAHDFPVKLNEVTRAYFERAAALQPEELGAAMRAVLEDPPDPDAVETLSAVPIYNAMLRTTCVATQLDAGHAENALPQRAVATVNCRMLPGASPNIVRATLVRITGNPRVTITPLKEAKISPPSPLTPDVLEPIERITEEMWPGVPVIPTMSTGATDGLFLRNAGIPVYGVSGIFIDIDDIRAHGRDERISIESFDQGQEFLYRLVVALSSSESSEEEEESEEAP